MWHFLFPADSKSTEPDQLFEAQYSALIEAKYSVSLCSDRVLTGFKPLTGIPPDSTVVYRGWMMTSDEYANLVRSIEQCGAKPLTTLSHYLDCHHLPNWYSKLADLTPETKVYSADSDLVSELRALDWGTYFLKDYVKSLKSGSGSIFQDPARAPTIVEELREYRGRIEGGICVRRFEPFVPGSEKRYFVIQGTGYSPDRKPVPRIVEECAERISSPYFSVDVALRSDGKLRVVEIGDGQVSDLVGWPIDAFVDSWTDSREPLSGQ